MFKLKINNILKNDKNLYELISGMSTSLFFKIIGILLGYIFTLLISKYYGAHSMGVFTIVYTVLMIFTVISKFGTDTSTLKFFSVYSKHENFEIMKQLYFTILLFIIPLSIFLSWILYFFADEIATIIFKKPNLKEYFQLLSFGILPLTLFSIHKEALRAMKQIAIYSFFQNASLFLLGSITIYILYLTNIITDTMQLLSIILFSIWINFIISSLLFFYKIKSYIYLNKMKDKKKLSINMKQLLEVSTPLFFANSLALMMFWTDTIMLGIYKSESEVGIYSVAYKISMLVNIFIIAINTVGVPKIAQYWGDQEIHKIKDITQKTAKVVFWLSLPITLILYIFSSNILKVFGEDFTIGNTTLIILTIGQYIIINLSLASNILKMTDKQKVFQKIMILSLIINISLNYFLIPIYGMDGAAISSIISFLFMHLASILMVHNYYSINAFYLPLISKIIRKRK